MKPATSAILGILCTIVLILPSCTPPDGAKIGEPAPLSRRELLYYASEISVGLRENDPEWKTDPHVKDILKIEGRPDLLFVVVSDQWCQGHAEIIDPTSIRAEQIIADFSPGPYQSVSRFTSTLCNKGTHIRIEYTTARGNPAGFDEFVLKPDNSIHWIVKNIEY